jgi:5'-phosphate synthase pdxT subunit
VGAPASSQAADPGGNRTTIGVLALQGDFRAHARVVEELGAGAREIRTPAQIDGLDGLILPGGESTTLLKLMEGHGFEQAMIDFHRNGKALFGTCAGMILLARRVLSPPQASLGLIDIDVERNAYGRQIDSFEANADWTAPELQNSNAAPLPMVFIRAPRLTRLGDGVTPLARCRGDVVLAREGRVLVASYHPEISDDARVHRLFLDLAHRRGE